MRHKIAIVWVVVTVIFFAGWAYLEEQRFNSGVSILVKTVPVDPRDLLSGQYLDLRYEFSGRRWDDRRWETDGETVWTVLAPDNQAKFHVFRSCVSNRPVKLAEGEVVLKGRRDYASGIVFGIERYYVPEGTPTPTAGNITVRLRVNERGSPRIEKVYVKGEPWP